MHCITAPSAVLTFCKLFKITVSARRLNVNVNEGDSLYLGHANAT